MKIQALLLWFAAASVFAGEAQLVRILDIELKVEPPKGFCLVGNGSESERRLWEGVRRSSAKVEVVQLAAACDELEAYRGGTAEYLNHVAFVAVPKTQGEVKAVPFSRAQFIDSIAKSRPIPKVDANEASRVMKKSLQDDSARVTGASTELLGIDDRAVYMAIHGSFESQERKSWRMTNLVAMTVAKSLPIGIYVTDVAGKPRAQSSDAVLREYLGLFLRDN